MKHNAKYLYILLFTMVISLLVGVGGLIYVMLQYGKAYQPAFQGSGIESPEVTSNTAGPSAGPWFSLTILHTNDVHSRILQFNRHGNTCSDEEFMEKKCFGGVSRRGTIISKIKKEKRNVLLLDAGDQFQGTLFFNSYQGKATQTFMNSQGYDAMTLGNHEFDQGSGVLAKFIIGLNFPVIVSNLDVSESPILQGLIKKSHILKMGDEKIGIVGYITRETRLISQPGPNVYFNFVKSSVKSEVENLIAKGINKIIALSHAGLEKDKQIAAKIEGIDVIISGHNHYLLSNSAQNSVGPYPLVVKSPSGKPVLIVTALAWGKYLGHLDLRFDSRGVAHHWQGDTILLKQSIPRDSMTLTKVMKMNQKLNLVREEIVGETAVMLQGDRKICRFHECNLGILIADALLWETRKRDTQIALINSGGIRASIPRGKVHRGQILEVLPFNDTVSTFKLKGAYLQQVLEYSVAKAANTRKDGPGAFLQVAGIKFRWNPALPKGKRVVKVEILDPQGGLTPLEDEKIYNLAASAFLRRGGDGYKILLEKAIKPYDHGRVIADVVNDYFHLNSPVSPQVEGRIKRHHRR